ncbi:MAG: hypothetical protein IIA60_01330 [Candidatus Marinimicrobia bacterium]|nr:hypothetical protein [Candidatus Neomarinimicrobiota bacterium]
MKESLTLLIKLQTVDTELMELEEALGDLPTQVKHLSRDLETVHQDTGEKEARVQEIEKEKRSLRATIDDTQVQLKRYKDQLLVVSTNRAYDALTTEIDGADKMIEDGEFHLLELDEEDQRLTDELKDDGLKAEAMGATLGTQQQQLKEALASTEQRSKALGKEREKLVSRIKPRFMSSYERIRAAREGRAVVNLSRGSCGACYNRVPVQRQMEIKAMDSIIICDGCGVILYWDSD